MTVTDVENKAAKVSSFRTKGFVQCGQNAHQSSPRICSHKSSQNMVAIRSDERSADGSVPLKDSQFRGICLYSLSSVDISLTPGLIRNSPSVAIHRAEH